MNSLYLGITHASGYIEELNGSKYIIFDSTDKNKELHKKYVFNGIIDKFKKISNDKFDYEKSNMKIEFNSDDGLPLNKSLNFHIMTITIRFVFEEDGEVYQQVFLHEALYSL